MQAVRPFSFKGFNNKGLEYHFNWSYFSNIIFKDIQLKIRGYNLFH